MKNTDTNATRSECFSYGCTKHGALYRHLGSMVLCEEHARTHPSEMLNVTTQAEIDAHNASN